MSSLGVMLLLQRHLGKEIEWTEERTLMGLEPKPALEARATEGRQCLKALWDELYETKLGICNFGFCVVITTTGTYVMLVTCKRHSPYWSSKGGNVVTAISQMRKLSYKSHSDSPKASQLVGGGAKPRCQLQLLCFPTASPESLCSVIRKTKRNFFF